MPTKKLTKRLIDQLEPGSERFDIWDTEVTGLGLRVSKDGRKVFVLKYRTADGTQRKPLVGVYGAVTLDQARGIARDWLALVRAGGDPSLDRQEKRKAPTVAELADRYMEEYAKTHKKPASVDSDDRMIRLYVKPLLGTQKVSAVTMADIERIHRGLKKCPIRANRVLALLSKMFNLSEKWKLRPEYSNPVRHVEKYPEKPVHRPMTDEELFRLETVLTEAEIGDPPESAENPVAVAALRLLIFTGMRRNEVLRLRWAEVDIKAGVLMLADSKTGPRDVVLNSKAREIVAGQKPMLGNPFVFPSPVLPGKPICDARGAWKRIRARAGLEDVRLHDLRHNYAAIAASEGQSLHQIGQGIGDGPRTTQRYAGLVIAARKRDAEQVGQALTEAMKPGK